MLNFVVAGFLGHHADYGGELPVPLASNRPFGTERKQVDGAKWNSYPLSCYESSSWPSKEQHSCRPWINGRRRKRPSTYSGKTFLIYSTLFVLLSLQFYFSDRKPRRLSLWLSAALNESTWSVSQNSPNISCEFTASSSDFTQNSTACTVKWTSEDNKNSSVNSRRQFNNSV